jgi:hypothetical protein
VSKYPEWKQSRCVHCAAGLPMTIGSTHNHWTGNNNPPACTAPTEAQYIAELQTVLGAMIANCYACNGTGEVEPCRVCRQARKVMHA